MGSKIGIRSEKFDDVDIDDFYKDFKFDKDKFITNSIQNEKQKKINELKDLNQRYKPWRWEASMTIVNAYSFLQENEIVFPLGIMQPPFFDQDAPSVVNYGAIGYFIGHEIGHSFDTSGRQYDEKGRVRDWWTPEDERKYNKRAQCYIDQYSNFRNTQVNMMINGTRSKTENIADNLGISQAYQAYKRYVSENPTELPLPNLGLTNEQVFFLSAAQTWCIKGTDESIRERIQSSPYATDNFRIIGMMQNSQEFAAAFKCQSWDYMNPANKCKMW